MAITSFERFSNKNITQSCSKSSHLSSDKLAKCSWGADGSISSNSEYDSKGCRNISPYLNGDRIHLLSRVTEKKLVHKRTTDFMSSFPLAVNIYKANSDQLRSSKRRSKKAKKSVLTLPNEQAPLPQACTVSDLNDSEFFNDNKDEEKSKPKKRRSINNRNPVKSRELKVFDRDSKYCSQLNIDLDKSSTDMINQYTGDGQKIKKKCNRKLKKSDVSNKINVKAHDVWSVLRNINKFPFRPTPSMSQDSFVSLKKGKNKNRRHINQRDTRYIETSRMEEFAYISNFVDEDPFQNAHSQSSIDRITVISRQDDFQEINMVLNKKLPNQIAIGSKKNIRSNNAIKLQKRRLKKSDTKIKNDDKKSDKTVCHDKLYVETTSNERINIQCDENYEQNKKKNPTNASIINNCLLQKKSTISPFQLNVNNNYKKMISPDYLESSKICNFSNKIFTITDTNNLEKCNSEEHQDVTGITKVVLSKGQNILLTKQLDAVKRKPRLTTTLPNNSIMPKLTQTEIKRRLSCMRFPLVILGKDQVSSSFKVETYDPPQFEGLNEHIWPFMKNWFHKNTFDIFENDIKENFATNNCNKIKCNTDKFSIDNNNNSNNLKDINTSLREKMIDPSMAISTKKNTSSMKEPVIRKIKPMSKVKNKMMNIIHKKSDSKIDAKINSVNTYSITNSQDASSIAIDIGTNTQNSLTMAKQSNTILKKDERNNRTSFNKSYQWAKRKWASDFIDNVIKKIKSGVYFYQEEEFQKRKNIMEESAQTETAVDTSDKCDSSLVAENIGPIVLPGFDDRLSDLEIETVKNLNQIAVKHCVTNTVIQFDIALKPEISYIQINKSFSCIPLPEKDNLKIFKCKTTIINAVLPAELCTVLPNLMKKILKSNCKLVLPTPLIEKMDDHLPPITEITQCESLHAINLFRNKIIPKQIAVTSDERTFEHGQFPKISPVSVIKNIVKDNIKWTSRSMLDLMEAQDILMHIQMNLLKNALTELLISSPILSFNSSSKPQVSSSSDLNSFKKPNCLTVQPYMVSNKKVYPAFKKINFMSLAESLLCHQFLNINKNTPLINNFKIIFHNDHNYLISIRIETTNIKETTRINYTISNVQINSIYNGVKSRLKNKENKALACILDKNTAISEQRRTDKRKPRRPSEYSVNNKRRGFIKLYKKCKSMSNLHNERSSTALNKITNLDDFLLALGSSKALSSVLDGNVEKKIMLAIKEMKNWTDDITPRQALLVLLLANKKDTSNLIRYRPIILQGIAVNRITRSMELDMEIEVIERENLNGLPKYDGITYLPASVENQDNLFEELCWIAKTTASDYQKIFDESSEKHLKSLLEKRKKLNPSYLRVMARYIGLGLLKNPK